MIAASNQFMSAPKAVELVATRADLYSFNHWKILLL